MKLKSAALLAASMLMMSASAAFAHTGEYTASGFLAGFSHPLFGADHVLAMVAVGLWAGLTGGRAQALIPASFLAAMALGSVMGAEGLGLPAVELGIALSVVALGALVAVNPSLPVAVSMALVAGFAVFHGHAHGAEMAEGVNGFTYGLGFIAATALLHGTGLAAVVAVKRRGPQMMLRIAGGAVGAAGVALLAA
ncbi:MAG: HupE/UreJ family protein [Rhodospirillaceae bacterium]|nr:HupE/UreJ family protein [Rhodospirillaceae bacterium]